jgi:hypothetical protein
MQLITSEINLLLQILGTESNLDPVRILRNFTARKVECGTLQSRCPTHLLRRLAKVSLGPVCILPLSVCSKYGSNMYMGSGLILRVGIK